MARCGCDRVGTGPTSAVDTESLEFWGQSLTSVGEIAWSLLSLLWKFLDF